MWIISKVISQQWKALPKIKHFFLRLPSVPFPLLHKWWSNNKIHVNNTKVFLGSINKIEKKNTEEILKKISCYMYPLYDLFQWHLIKGNEESIILIPMCLNFFDNSFVKIYFTCHGIHHFKAYNSLAFNI